MSQTRLWHPAHDAYHAAFRMIRILLCKDNSVMEVERLFTLDFFIAYPCLLHKTYMKADLKEEFRSLDVQKPSSYFVNLPSAVSLYRDMELIQLESLKSLVGKEICSKEMFLKKSAQLNRKYLPKELEEKALSRNAENEKLMDFLVNKFGSRPILELRESTGFKGNSA